MQYKIAMIAGCLIAATLSQCAHADSFTGADKANHFAISAALAKLTSDTHGKGTGIALALLPGIAKEVSDLTGTGQPSIKDMAANVLGAIVGSVLPQQYMIAPIAPRGAIDGISLSFLMEI